MNFWLQTVSSMNATVMNDTDCMHITLDAYQEYMNDWFGTWHDIKLFDIETIHDSDV